MLSQLCGLQRRPDLLIANLRVRKAKGYVPPDCIVGQEHRLSDVAKLGLPRTQVAAYITTINKQMAAHWLQKPQDDVRQGGLPAPLAPTRARASPREMRRVTAFSASTVPVG